ncbi:MAG: TetR/AcrR family transcriptional regulator, partial [Bacillota bacterium]
YWRDIYMNGFERLKEHKKAAIKMAVKELTSRKGIESLSMKAIAKTAGVSQVTIYNHFKSKNELIKDVSRSLMEELYNAYFGILNSNHSFMEKLELILNERIRAVFDGSWNMLISAAEWDYEIDQMLKTGPLLKLKSRIYDLIEQGKDEGIVKNSIETNTIMQYLEMFRNWFDIGLDQAANEKKAKDLLELFIYGIRGNIKN